MFSLLAWLITILAVIVGTIYLYLTWNFNYWRNRGLRTAQPLTIFGSLPNIVTRKRNFVLDIHDIYEKYKHDNRAVGIFVTRRPEILILHPKLIHDVLVTNFTQFRDTITSTWVDDRNEDKFVSRNPFWCAGEEWKQRRSDAVAGLTQNKLKQSYAIWENSCGKLRKFLEENMCANNGLIETKDIAYRFCADAMCDFIWGIDSGALTKPKESNAIVEVTGKWSSYAFEMLSYYAIITIAPFMRVIRPQRFYPKDTDEFFSKLQKDAVDMRRKNPNPDRPDFLNYLLQLAERKDATLDDLTGHSLTVLLDGYETTATVLMHSLFYLAMNPHTQKKLRLEIQNALKEEKGSLTYEKLAGLAYLDQCIHETLRLTTVIPIFNRICIEPTSLEISEGKTLDIPVDMVAVIPVYSVHLDEQYYLDPHTFNPERFDNGAHIELIKKGVFLPFGDGPRICIGRRVGLMSIRSAIVEILSHYEILKCPLTPNENAKNLKSFILTLQGDVWFEYKTLKMHNN